MGNCAGMARGLSAIPKATKGLTPDSFVCADKQDISNFQWWILIFNYQMPCRSTATPGPIREVIQVHSPSGSHTYTSLCRLARLIEFMSCIPYVHMYADPCLPILCKTRN